MANRKKRYCQRVRSMERNPLEVTTPLEPFQNGRWVRSICQSPPPGELENWRTGDSHIPHLPLCRHPTVAHPLVRTATQTGDEQPLVDLFRQHFLTLEWLQPDRGPSSAPSPSPSPVRSLFLGVEVVLGETAKPGHCLGDCGGRHNVISCDTLQQPSIATRDAARHGSPVLTGRLEG